MFLQLWTGYYSSRALCLSLCCVTWVAHREVVLCRGEKKGLKTPKRNKYWPVLLLKVDTQHWFLLIIKGWEGITKWPCRYIMPSHLDPVTVRQRELVSPEGLSHSVPNTFKYVNIWTLATSNSGCCFNEARCAAVGSQHPAQSLSLRCRRFDLVGEEPKESCGLLCPWALKWWNQSAEWGWKSSAWWIASLD